MVLIRFKSDVLAAAIDAVDAVTNAINVKTKQKNGKYRKRATDEASTDHDSEMEKVYCKRPQSCGAPATGAARHRNLHEHLPFRLGWRL